MSTTYWRETILVRRKGTTDSVHRNGADFRSEDEMSGDRRSRQIGKRHWLSKGSTGWNSGGSHWAEVTMKLPNKPEVNLVRPIRG